MMKLEELRSLIRMHLARRGCRKSEKKISPKDIDGHVQNLRANLLETDLEHKGKLRTSDVPKAGGTPRPTTVITPSLHVEAD